MRKYVSFSDLLLTRWPINWFKRTIVSNLSYQWNNVYRSFSLRFSLVLHQSQINMNVNQQRQHASSSNRKIVTIHAANKEASLPEIAASVTPKPLSKPTKPCNGTASEKGKGSSGGLNNGEAKQHQHPATQTAKYYANKMLFYEWTLHPNKTRSWQIRFQDRFPMQTLNLR